MDGSSELLISTVKCAALTRRAGAEVVVVVGGGV